MREVNISDVESLEQALQAVALPMLQQSESVAVAIEGESAFVHRISLPATALKQLDEILPFEIEAQIPVDIDQLVYDYRVLKRAASDAPVVTLTAAARTDHVRSRIELISRALGREPDRVGCGPIPLVNLCSVSAALSGPSPVAVVDLGGRRTEVAIVAGEEVVFARTLSRGIEGLPASAAPLAAELRQTLMAWLSHGGHEPVSAAYLVGGGAGAQGADTYLTNELGIPVSRLPPLTIECHPDQMENVPHFAKAISLALGLGSRSRDLDLRRGPLEFQRGYAFLKEKVPLLSGLAAAILISFVFSTWAEMRALSREEETLTAALETLSQSVLKKPTTDAEEAMVLLEEAKRRDEADPMPELDAFDVIVEIAKAVPFSITHDIEEFDMHKSQVKVTGVTGSTADAQTVSNNLKQNKCLNDVKISKISQVINSDKQKYVLEFDARCPDEQGVKKKKKKKAESDTGGEP
jgi:general secretion pathway protein L